VKGIIPDLQRSLLESGASLFHADACGASPHSPDFECKARRAVPPKLGVSAKACHASRLESGLSSDARRASTRKSGLADPGRRASPLKSGLWADAGHSSPLKSSLQTFPRRPGTRSFRTSGPNPRHFFLDGKFLHPMGLKYYRDLGTPNTLFRQFSKSGILAPRQATSDQARRGTRQHHHEYS
jgi:hypothetical protein